MVEIANLTKLSAKEIRQQFTDLFPDIFFPGNRKFAERKIAYELQGQSLGALSEQTLLVISTMITAYDPINKRTFKTRGGNLSTTTGRDPRLPMPGSLVTKLYKGDRIEVKVLEDGFEYKGTKYKNLSAIAKAVTGSHWNGFGFFGLDKDGKN